MSIFKKTMAPLLLCVGFSAALSAMEKKQDKPTEQDEKAFQRGLQLCREISPLPRSLVEDLWKIENQLLLYDSLWEKPSIINLGDYIFTSDTIENLYREVAQVTTKLDVRKHSRAAFEKVSLNPFLAEAVFYQVSSPWIKNYAGKDYIIVNFDCPLYKLMAQKKHVSDALLFCLLHEIGHLVFNHNALVEGSCAQGSITETLKQELFADRFAFEAGLKLASLKSVVGNKTFSFADFIQGAKAFMQSTSANLKKSLNEHLSEAYDMTVKKDARSLLAALTFVYHQIAQRTGRGEAFCDDYLVFCQGQVLKIDKLPLHKAALPQSENPADCYESLFAVPEIEDFILRLADPEHPTPRERLNLVAEYERKYNQLINSKK